MAEGLIATIAAEASKAASSFSAPAKLAFIGYCVLAYAKSICTSSREFLIVASIFLFVEVLHDDFARIWLNIKAVQWATKKAGG
jgi:predicted metalloprotease with PDZ domain